MNKAHYLQTFFQAAESFVCDETQQKIIALKALIDKQRAQEARFYEFLNRHQINQSPLTFVLLAQNFNLAYQLIIAGAKAGPQERAAFEIACDSEAGAAFGFSPASEKGQILHTVKRFGLTLGITMTSADGTFSLMGHTAPTYQLMTESVASYVKNFPQTDFKAVAKAFEFANNTAAFSYSTSKNPEAGKEMAARIQSKSSQVTTIPISCKGHAMGLSIVTDGQGSGYLIFTNRGIGAKDLPGTQIFKLQDVTKVTPEFITNVMNGHSKGTSHAEIMRQIHQVTGSTKPLYYLEQSRQKRDNCTVANTRANIHGILLCQAALKKGKSVSDLCADERDVVKARYKHFTHAMRLDKINELAAELTQNPEDVDLKNLAQSYLKQHPHASADLLAPLSIKPRKELKLNHFPMTCAMDHMAELPSQHFKTAKITCS